MTSTTDSELDQTIPKSLKIAISLVSLAALGFAVWRHLEPPDDRPIVAETTRLPVSNPPLEPDRPDLIGEPRIDDETVGEQ